MTNFDASEYMSQFPKELLESSQGRRHLVKRRPMLFTLLYLNHHVSFNGELPDFSQFHLDLFDYGMTLAGVGQGIGQERHSDETYLQRDAWIAPRASGKSTMLFTVLPLWLAACEHVGFIAAFSDSENQATQHLQTLKSELDSNELLRLDFPELCRPKKSRATNKYVSQSQIMIQQDNGFVFSAKGIDSQSLGMKVGVRRPDVILCDDIESLDYSVNAAKARLNTLLHGVFALNYKGKIIIVGTAPIAGGILDNLRAVNDLLIQYKERQRSQLSNEQAIGDDEKPSGATSKTYQEQRADKDEQTNDDAQLSEGVNGETEQLDDAETLAIQKNDVKSNESDDTTSTTNNYMNLDLGEKPSSNDGEQKSLYPAQFEEQLDNELKWVVDHQIKVHHYLPIIEDEQGNEASLWPSQWSLAYLKSIAHTRDFAVNYLNRPVSMDAGYWTDEDIEIDRPTDEQGNIVPFDRVLLSVDPAVSTKKTADYSAFAVVGTVGTQVYVMHTEQLRGSPDELRAVTERLIDDYDVQLVLWEKNYGDSLWKAVLDGIPCKIRFIRNTEKKEARITQSLDSYQKGKVKHCKSMLLLEDQMKSFPATAHDDLIDSVATAVNYYCTIKPRIQVKQSSYI